MTLIELKELGELVKINILASKAGMSAAKIRLRFFHNLSKLTSDESKAMLDVLENYGLVYLEKGSFRRVNNFIKLTIGDLKYWAGILNIEAVSRKIGINGNTMASRISRGTPELTQEESDKILNVLENYGMIYIERKRK